MNFIKQSKWSGFFRSNQSASQEPKTDFPISPQNRWTNWQGILQANNERYIFTKSVCYYLYKVKFFYVFELYKEIDMAEAISRTYLKIQEICKKDDPRMRTIERSIKALVESWVFQYIRHLKKQLFQVTHYLDETIGVSDSKNVPANYFWKKEFGLTFQKALDTLSEQEKKVIELKLEDRTIEEISRMIGETRYLTDTIFKNASLKIDQFCKEAGFDLYRK
jgi:RNA polymerase sigma factor (sigma-70 family)